MARPIKVALMQGLALASQHSDKPVIVQSDSINALAILSGDTLSKSAYGHLDADIKAILVDRIFVSMKISRVQSRVAHLLAHYSRTECCTVVWLNSSPSCCEEQLSRDCNPIIMECNSYLPRKKRNNRFPYHARLLWW